MVNFFKSREFEALEIRIKAVEDTLLTLGSEIGGLKSRIASLLASKAVSERKDRKSLTDEAREGYNKALGDIFGGEVVAVIEDKDLKRDDK